MPARAVRSVRPPASPSRRWPAPRPARVLPEPPTDAEKACYPWRSLPSLAVAAGLGTLCGARGHVLDDGPGPDLMPMAAGFGFSYLRRPDLRWRRKAGNLNYAFARTSGQHIAIFDAGFRPRPDFLAETLPYLDDPAVGIVQTPPLLRVGRPQTWVERAARPRLEVFYRAGQASRNRFSSAVGVGPNAVYRHAALAPAGGFTLLPHAEDSHTGLDARFNGYRLTHIPVPLAAGTGPATLEDFLRQQYRCCWRAASLVWTRHMWRVPMPPAARLPYLTGWLGHRTGALRTLILPLIPIILLALAPEEISLRNGLLLIPAVLSAVVLGPLGQSSRYRPGTWTLSLVMGWAQVLGLWDYARGRVLSRAQVAPGQGHAIRRFWWGVATWNGGLAAAWIAIALWRAMTTGSGQFAVVAASGGVPDRRGAPVLARGDDPPGPPAWPRPLPPSHLPVPLYFPLHCPAPRPPLRAGPRGWPSGAVTALPRRRGLGRKPEAELQRDRGQQLTRLVGVQLPDPLQQFLAHLRVLRPGGERAGRVGAPGPAQLRGGHADHGGHPGQRVSRPAHRRVDPGADHLVAAGDLAPAALADARAACGLPGREPGPGESIGQQGSPGGRRWSLGHEATFARPSHFCPVS